MTTLVLLALIFLTVPFTFLDVWYFVRLIVLFVSMKFWRTRDYKKHPISIEEFLKPSYFPGIVLPSDLDLYLHMNNSKYLREFDLGRTKLSLEGGVGMWLRRHNCFWVVTATSIRFRRELRLFQRFKMVTKFVWWEEDALYLEQRMVKPDGFVAAIMLVKVAVRGMPVSKVQECVCGCQFSPPDASPEIKSWCDSISASSKQLKKEVGRH